MKSILVIIFLFSCGNVFAQKKYITGFGVLQIGKSTIDILQSLHINLTDIIDGSSETIEQFNQVVQDHVIRVQYNYNSVLGNSLQSLDKDDCGNYKFMYKYIKRCPDVDQYFIPKYEWNGILLKHLILVFHENKLVEIYTLSPEAKLNEKLWDYFSKKYPDYGGSNETNDNVFKVWGGDNQGPTITYWSFYDRYCDKHKEVETEDFSIAENNYWYGLRLECDN